MSLGRVQLEEILVKDIVLWYWPGNLRPLYVQRTDDITFKMVGKNMDQVKWKGMTEEEKGIFRILRRVRGRRERAKRKELLK